MFHPGSRSLLVLPAGIVKPPPTSNVYLENSWAFAEANARIPMQETKAKRFISPLPRQNLMHASGVPQQRAVQCEIVRFGFRNAPRAVELGASPPALRASGPLPD